MIKPASQMQDEEPCVSCGKPMDRLFLPRTLHLSKTKVFEASYNPGLGCVVKSESHKQELCKQKGLVEIGNDYKSPDTQAREGDQTREHRYNTRWNQAMREAV